MEELLPAAGACEGEIRIVQLYGKPCPTIGRSRMNGEEQKGEEGNDEHGFRRRGRHGYR